MSIRGIKSSTDANGCLWRGHDNETEYDIVQYDELTLTAMIEAVKERYAPV